MDKPDMRTSWLGEVRERDRRLLVSFDPKCAQDKRINLTFFDYEEDGEIRFDGYLRVSKAEARHLSRAINRAIKLDR